MQQTAQAGNNSVDIYEVNEINYMKELIKFIKPWIFEKKTGKVTINFFKGGISSLTKEESVKLNK